MPIDFVILRASSIPEWVNNERTNLKAGITGSDIIWESGLGKYTGEKIPVEEVLPDAKQSSLFIGVTQDFYDFAVNRLCGFDDPSTYALKGFTIATKYPNIAQEVLAEKKIDDVNIFPVPGTDEAIQYIMNCEGIVGIVSSQDTVKANDVQILELFYKVSVKMIEASDKLSRRDKTILDNLRERIELALQRRRMI